MKKLSQLPQLKPLREDKNIRKTTNQPLMTPTQEPQEIEAGINQVMIGEQAKEMKEQMADQASPEALNDQTTEVEEINPKEEKEVTVEVEEEQEDVAFKVKKIVNKAVFLLMIFSEIPEKTKVELEAIAVEELEVVEVREAPEVTEEIVETEVVIASSVTTEEPEEVAPIQADLEEADIGGKKKKKSITNKKTSLNPQMRLKSAAKRPER